MAEHRLTLEGTTLNGKGGGGGGGEEKRISSTGRGIMEQEMC